MRLAGFSCKFYIPMKNKVKARRGNDLPKGVPKRESRKGLKKE